MTKYKLGDICDIVSGGTPKTGIKEYWNGNLKWITPAEINDDSYIINDSVRKITEMAVDETKLSSFPKGTVILSSRAPIGKVAIAGCEMYCNQGFKNLVCSNIINNRYLYWFLKSKTSYLNSLGRGATFKEISKSIVAGIEINVPEFQEQEEIAIKLERINKLIELRKEEVSSLDELIRSRFVEMFGDPEENQFEWITSTVGNLISSCEAGWSGNGTQRKKNDGEIAVLKVSAVTKGYFDPDECKVLDDQDAIKKYVYPQAGDLLFSRANTREMVGATAVITQDYPEHILPDKLWKVRFCDVANVWYMKYILSSQSIRSIFSSVSTGTSGSMFNVSMEKFKSIRVPLPPIELQQQFADFVAQVDKSKVAVQKALDETQLLFDSLMQEYFG